MFELRIKHHLLQEHDAIYERVLNAAYAMTDALSIVPDYKSDHLHLSPWSKGVNLLDPASAAYRLQSASIMSAVARAFYDGQGLADDLSELHEVNQAVKGFDYARGARLRMCGDNFEIRRGENVCNEADVMLALAGILHAQSRHFNSRTQSNYMVPAYLCTYPDIGKRNIQAACAYHVIESSLIKKDGSLGIPYRYINEPYVVRDIRRELDLVKFGLLDNESAKFEEEKERGAFISSQARQLHSIFGALRLDLRNPRQFKLAETLPENLKGKEEGMRQLLGKINALFPVHRLVYKPSVPCIYATSPANWDESPAPKAEWSFARQSAVRLKNSPVLTNTISADTLDRLESAMMELYGVPTGKDAQCHAFLEAQLRRQMSAAQALVKHRS